MKSTRDNETWVVETGGDIVDKRSEVGFDAMSPTECLIYWLWWADYMMRNAGDFANAEDLAYDFQQEIVRNAQRLDLPFTKETFSLLRADLQNQYFDRFDRVCEEVRNA